MKYWSRVCFFFLAVFCIFAVPGLRADEDPSDFRTVVEPGFVLDGETYARFDSPEYPLEKSVDNLLIAVDLETAPQAIVRAYARFRDEKSGSWGRFREFEGECHFAALEPINAYQVMFIIRDPGKGKTTVRRITTQGRRLGEELMKSLTQKPAPFKALRAWAKPPVVTRQQWNARKPKSGYTAQKIEKIVLHHSWAPTQAQYKGSATIRGIQNYHMDDPNTGWMDIGYHFLIGPDGLIYEGRPEGAVGAHCPPNTNMVGICVIGNYDPNADQVNAKIETSLVNLLSWLSSTYGVDPKSCYFGHRNFSSKSCPGDMVCNRLSYYQEQVLGNIGEMK